MSAQPGDTISIKQGSLVLPYQITRTTKTRAYYDGGSIALNCLCQLGNTWLEMAKPSAKKIKPLTAAERQQRVPSTKIKIFGGIEYAPGKFDWSGTPGVNADNLHEWRRNKWIRAEHQGCWHFCIEDAKKIAAWRDPVGRIVGGKQFYTPKEIARRTGEGVGRVAAWGRSEHVERHSPDGAVVALSWGDVKQHMKYLGIELVEVKL